jgi:hypothetical protein
MGFAHTHHRSIDRDGIAVINHLANRFVMKVAYVLPILLILSMVFISGCTSSGNSPVYSGESNGGSAQPDTASQQPMQAYSGNSDDVGTQPNATAQPSADLPAQTETSQNPPITLNTVKNPEDILPTRDDIPTEFTIDTKKDTLDKTGFQYGVALMAEKVVGDYSPGLIDIYFYVYNFTSASDAKSYYQERVDEVKNNGGYTKISISTSSECFSYKEDYGFYEGRFRTSLCNKGNIYFSVEVVAAETYESIDSYIKDMTLLVDGKVA